jgi:hypothetical protein
VKRWASGELVVRRDVWLGHVRHATPSRAVVDSAEQIIWWTAPGTVYKAATAVRGDMARSDITPGEGWRDRTWFGGGALHLVRPGDHYAIVALFDGAGELESWYVNLQLPVERSPIGFDTMDLILDVVVAPDLSRWKWKDEDQFQDAVDRSIFDAVMASNIRSSGLAAVQRLRADAGAFEKWRDWAPPASWTNPSLPSGWDVA